MKSLEKKRNLRLTLAQKEQVYAVWEQHKDWSVEKLRAVCSEFVTVSESAFANYISAFRRGRKPSDPITKSSVLASKHAARKGMVVQKPDDNSLNGQIRRLVNDLRTMGISRMTIEQNGKVAIERTETFSV